MFRRAFVALTLTASLTAAATRLDSPLGPPAVRADAIVLVNSTSVLFPEFQIYIEPYLKNFGIPYGVVDIATTEIDATLGEYAVIIVGHGQLDLDNLYLSGAEQDHIVDAVEAGTGLVNFDRTFARPDLTGRYAFVDEIFGFQYNGTLVASSGVAFPSVSNGSPPGGARDGEWDYVTAYHPPFQVISTGPMGMADVSLPADVVAVATSGGLPFLSLTVHGLGRALQWGTYDWMELGIKGPLYGLDDLVWRGIAWAARKPFVMQGMLPFVVLRVDDVSGPLWWIDVANQHGFKPFAGVFPRQLDVAETTHLSTLCKTGKTTASIHSWTWPDFFYFNHNTAANFQDPIIAQHYVDGTRWHRNHDIPISKFVVPHFNEIGSNAFTGLLDWDVEFVTHLHDPGLPWGAPWLVAGPYRLYEPRRPGPSLIPFYYADFVTVPGHPELDGEFFLCTTQILDIGPEWLPSSNTALSIDEGTRWLKRAMESLVVPMLFTHEYWITPLTVQQWSTILSGIKTNIAPWEPLYVTIDEAGFYARAMVTSDIVEASYDGSQNSLTVTHGGEADIPTKFFLFTEPSGPIQKTLVDVAPFTGTQVVVYSLD